MSVHAVDVDKNRIFSKKHKKENVIDVLFAYERLWDYDADF